MKRIACLILLVFLVGCSAEETPETENITEVIETSVHTSSVAAECNSLCNIDENFYCEQERTIEVNEKNVVGTCRAFSKHNISGFERCETFCRFYGEEGTVCKVNGNTDDNCDGII